MKLFGSSGGKKPQDGRPHIENRTAENYDNYAAPGVTKDENVDVLVREYSHKKRRRRIIAAVVLIVLVVGVFVAYPLLVHPPETNPTGINTPVSTSTVTPDSQEDPAPDDEPEITDDPNSLRKAGVFTFVCVGSDDGGGNTDTILLGMLDIKNQKLNAVSVPRDTLVNVSWGTKKVNTIYSNNTPEDATDAEKGAGLLAGFKDILGYTADFYVHIDMRAFEKLVDTIGGVYFDVPIDMEYYDPKQDFWMNIKAGPQTLNGVDALKVVRFRADYPDADLGRIRTQQEFLKATAKQLLQIGNIPKINEFAQIFTEYVDTSLTINHIAWLGQQFLKLDEDDISFFKMPGDEGPWLPAGTIPGGSYIYRSSYVNADIDAWLEMLNEYINPWKEEITRENLNMMIYDRVAEKYYSTTGVFAK